MRASSWIVAFAPASPAVCESEPDTPMEAEEGGSSGAPLSLEPLREPRPSQSAAGSWSLWTPRKKRVASDTARRFRARKKVQPAHLIHIAMTRNIQGGSGLSPRQEMWAVNARAYPPCDPPCEKLLPLVSVTSQLPPHPLPPQEPMPEVVHDGGCEVAQNEKASFSPEPPYLSPGGPIPEAEDSHIRRAQPQREDLRGSRPFPAGESGWPNHATRTSAPPLLPYICLLDCM